jgi:hypothetical protein
MGLSLSFNGLFFGLPLFYVGYTKVAHGMFLAERVGDFQAVHFISSGRLYIVIALLLLMFSAYNLGLYVKCREISA